MRKCLFCGEALPDAEEDTVFCEDCLRGFRKLCRDVCPNCGAMERNCRCVPKKLRGKVGFSVHLFAYHEDFSRRIVYSMKLQNLPFLRRFLAKELSELILEATSGNLLGYTVSFVPRKPRSIRVYGFDQAEELARFSAEYLHLPFDRIFGHSRFSKLQKRLNMKERGENADNSFFLRGDFVRRTDRLLIFDDVLTTGSTLSALVMLAKAAGFYEVSVVCLANTKRI